MQLEPVQHQLRQSRCFQQLEAMAGNARHDGQRLWITGQRSQQLGEPMITEGQLIAYGQYIGLPDQIEHRVRAEIRHTVTDHKG